MTVAEAVASSVTAMAMAAAMYRSAALCVVSCALPRPRSDFWLHSPLSERPARRAHGIHIEASSCPGRGKRPWWRQARHTVAAILPALVLGLGCFWLGGEGRHRRSGTGSGRGPLPLPMVDAEGRPSTLSAAGPDADAGPQDGLHRPDTVSSTPSARILNWLPSRAKWFAGRIADRFL